MMPNHFARLTFGDNIVMVNLVGKWFLETHSILLQIVKSQHMSLKNINFKCKLHLDCYILDLNKHSSLIGDQDMRILQVEREKNNSI